MRGERHLCLSRGHLCVVAGPVNELVPDPESPLVNVNGFSHIVDMDNGVPEPHGSSPYKFLRLWFATEIMALVRQSNIGYFQRSSMRPEHEVLAETLKQRPCPGDPIVSKSTVCDTLKLSAAELPDSWAPPAVRTTVCRKPQRLGVAQIGDGVVALPEDTRTRERLKWNSDRCEEANGATSEESRHNGQSSFAAERGDGLVLNRRGGIASLVVPPK